MLARATVLAAAAAALTATSAQAAAPGWSTPQTVSSYRVGTYGAGSGGQSVQLFGNGSVQSMTAQLRPIKSNASQGTAVGVDAGEPGFDFPSVALNPSGGLVAAWTLDTESTAPIGIAMTVGSRSALPRTATILPNDGQDVTDLATAIDAEGTGIAAWIEMPRNTNSSTLKAATLHAGQAPKVVTVATRAGGMQAVNVGLDGDGRPIITWVAATGVVGLARGDGDGAFAPAVEQTLSTVDMGQLQTFVLSTGAVLAFWLEGDETQQAVKTALAAAGAPFGAPRTLIAGDPGRPPVAFAANASGRAAVVFPLTSGKGVTLRVILRTNAGNWGSTRTLGKPGRAVTRVGLGVSSDGRAVVLWDDGSSSANRILAARASSPTSSLSSYSQVSQRSGESRCNAPTLFLAASGDGLGRWACATSSSGSINQPRLARLTAP